MVLVACLPDFFSDVISEWRVSLRFLDSLLAARVRYKGGRLFAVFVFD